MPGVEFIAFRNGRRLPFSQLAVSPTDAGFVLGVTVAEQLRTFGGRLFRLEQHLARLQRSLKIVGVDCTFSMEQLAREAVALTADNYAALGEQGDPPDDLGLTLFVTPGPYSTFTHSAAERGPVVAMYNYRLPFGSWCEKYEQGETLVVSTVRQVPAECWPTELKCRSRMHYYLADQEARQRQPGARAVLVDTDGRVTEASTANLLIYRQDEGLVSPPRERILPGVSVNWLEALAGELGIPFVHRELWPSDLATADEMLLCSTSPCVWPVTQLDGKPIGNGRRGPISRQLLAAWSQAVGVDIEAQASRFRERR